MKSQNVGKSAKGRVIWRVCLLSSLRHEGFVHRSFVSDSATCATGHFREVHLGQKRGEKSGRSNQEKPPPATPAVPSKGSQSQSTASVARASDSRSRRVIARPARYSSFGEYDSEQEEAEEAEEDQNPAQAHAQRVGSVNEFEEAEDTTSEEGERASLNLDSAARLISEPTLVQAPTGPLGHSLYRFYGLSEGGIGEFVPESLLPSLPSLLSTSSSNLESDQVGSEETVMKDVIDEEQEDEDMGGMEEVFETRSDEAQVSTTSSILYSILAHLSTSLTDPPLGSLIQQLRNLIQEGVRRCRRFVSL